MCQPIAVTSSGSEPPSNWGAGLISHLSSWGSLGSGVHLLPLRIMSACRMYMSFRHSRAAVKRRCNGTSILGSTGATPADDPWAVKRFSMKV